MFSYSYNEDMQELTVFEEDMALATVSDVSEEQAEDMFVEVVYEMRGVEL